MIDLKEGMAVFAATLPLGQTVAVLEVIAWAYQQGLNDSREILAKVLDDERSAVPQEDRPAHRR